jgi:hypothetical protein
VLLERTRARRSVLGLASHIQDQSRLTSVATDLQDFDQSAYSAGPNQARATPSSNISAEMFYVVGALEMNGMSLR